MMNKRIKLIVHEPSVNRIVGSELTLELSRDANFVTAINEVDRLISQRGGFPLPEYRCLLHMIYNPVENRFYRQVAVAAYKEGQDMINLRANPKQILPADVTVVLIPAGGCIGEWEEVIDFQQFMKAMQSI